MKENEIEEENGVYSFLQAFWEKAEGRCAFELTNGVSYEGYLVEVSQKEIVFYSGGPGSTEAPLILPLDSIRLDSLFYYDSFSKEYLSFPLPKNFKPSKKQKNRE
jgi:hypothetical protein